ncbi:hypothetical protein B0I33_103215 [Prauserella shujinwangii]|uniref:Uncharacterized protein n=1 Tax=Prauserella shujinwangii TaxID=1453103 RepID=A0A2T0LYP8_9PSEU|nr:hypothetical protein [Prauserella shujinwangii]PRX49182.1 hypothetical protein B0I33_103215 [Prauserella shujinwangii]
MSFEEKRAWILAVVAVVAYAVYVAVVLGRAGDVPLPEVPYAAAMAWTIGSAIAAGILLDIVAAAVSPEDAGRKDERDREIGRFGEHVGQSFVVIGGVTALVMALVELDHFWIANAIYLAFVLSAVLGSTTKIVAYRWGFPRW